MKLGTKAAAYGAAGLVLAGVVILSGSALGLLNPQSSGVLSVMLTDPPSIPANVSAVYITYSALAVHANGFGDGGWVAVSAGGTVETYPNLVNFSQTISSGDVPSLTYNLVRLNIVGAQVEYMGKNYSAMVGSGEITVPFVGGLKVNSSGIAAALIDIHPTILNLGTQSNPSFTLAAGAQALQVPSSDVDGSFKTVGHTFELQGHGWFESFNAKSSEISSSGVSLSGNSLSISVANGGSDQVAVRMVIVTPASSNGERGAFGSIVNGDVFAVESDGSLKPLSGTPGQVESLFNDTGYTLAAGTTHQFTYTGTITSLVGDRGIVSGASYYVVVMGMETLIVQTVAAT